MLHGPDSLDGDGGGGQQAREDKQGQLPRPRPCPDHGPRLHDERGLDERKLHDAERVRRRRGRVVRRVEDPGVVRPRHVVARQGPREVQHQEAEAPHGDDERRDLHEVEGPPHPGRREEEQHHDQRH